MSVFHERLFDCETEELQHSKDSINAKTRPAFLSWLVLVLVLAAGIALITFFPAPQVPPSPQIGATSSR